MDQFTLMCSKLEELQREWRINFQYGDRYWYFTEINLDSEPTPNARQNWIGAIRFVDDEDETYYGEDPEEWKDCIWLPTLEQMIGMMPKEEHEWVLGYCFYRYDASAWADTNHSTWMQLPNAARKSWSNKDCKISLLQALAWSRWSKEWDQEKGEWHEG